jgi:outer membrane protein assembly factor BamA
VINFSGGLKTSRELVGSHWADKQQLPPFSNFNFYSYGVGYEWNNLDDIFFPHRGWYLSTQLAGGNKVIHKSSGFADSLYNNISLNSVQFSLNLLVEKHTPIGRRSVLYNRFESGKVFNNQKNIFFNDLYRVGGLKSLRGFAENYFYASMYAVGTLEYRFFTEETSYLLLFFDQGFINNSLMSSGSTDFPFGFGAGVSFSTGVGIFNFTYSLGNSNTQKINLNVSKIHFGIISRF